MLTIRFAILISRLEVKHAVTTSVLSCNYSTCFLNKFHALRASIYLFPLLLLQGIHFRTNF